MHRSLTTVRGTAVALLVVLATTACTATPPTTSPGHAPSPTTAATTAVGATASPSPAAIPPPTPEPEGELFISERYGYSLRLPGEDWWVVERPGEWRPGTTFIGDGPGVDRALAPIQQYLHDVFLNSQPLESGTSFEAWFESYDELQRTSFSNCTFDDGYETTTIDVVEARINTAVCRGDRWAEALWAHGGRVYSLRVGERRDSGTPIEPRDEIEEWLDRITLNRVAP